MCLTAEHLKAHVATEDIKCYKILQKDMKSYYYGDFQWEIGKLYETEMETINRNPQIIGQAFHSYCSYPDVQEILIHTGMPSLMVECTIPKGAMYFEGYHGYDTSGYASNQLIVNRVIPREELFPDFDFENFPYKVGQKIRVSDNNDESGTCMTIEEIVPNDKGVYIKTNYIITYMCVSILMTDKEGQPLFDYSPSITIIE